MDIFNFNYSFKLESEKKKGNMEVKIKRFHWKIILNLIIWRTKKKKKWNDINIKSHWHVIIVVQTEKMKCFPIRRSWSWTTNRYCLAYVPGNELSSVSCGTGPFTSGHVICSVTFNEQCSEYVPRCLYLFSFKTIEMCLWLLPVWFREFEPSMNKEYQ